MTFELTSNQLELNDTEYREVLWSVLVDSKSASTREAINWCARWLDDQTALASGALLPVGPGSEAYKDYASWVGAKSGRGLPRKLFARVVGALAQLKARRDGLPSDQIYAVGYKKTSAGVVVAGLALKETLLGTEGLPEVRSSLN